MRALVVALIVGVLAAHAWADIEVPGTHRYVEEVTYDSGTPDTTWAEVEVTGIQQAIDLAYELINDEYAGYPGHDDVVLLAAATYDSVSNFETPLGRRTALCYMREGVTLRGADADDVVLHQGEANYGILVCYDVGPDTHIEDLTVSGGAGGVRGGGDDVRSMNAAVACLDGASPTISGLRIEDGATGIVVWSGTSPSAPTIENVVIARGGHNGIYIYENGTTPVVINHATIVSNADHGVYLFGGSATITNSCITHNGKEGINTYLAVPTVRYCNVFWNDRESTEPEGPENYGGMEDLTNQFGNISSDPYYCGFSGAQGYDYHVCTPDSPNLTAAEDGGDIGALGAGCTDCVAPVEAASWGLIKGMYR